MMGICGRAKQPGCTSIGEGCDEIELTQAKEDPYLAVLSALAHGHEDSQESAGIAYTALVTLLHLPNKEMDSESAQACLLTIWRGLGALAKKQCLHGIHIRSSVLHRLRLYKGIIQ